ncbi:hypothetical protein ACQEVF_57960 [Nonomuraea polychroma]|uniref:hypothetical protein n=1 Tax=Nonomuraea polychroma TaxID=46176 RepID=UPI003D8C29BF
MDPRARPGRARRIQLPASILAAPIADLAVVVVAFIGQFRRGYGMHARTAAHQVGVARETYQRALSQAKPWLQRDGAGLLRVRPLLAEERYVWVPAYVAERMSAREFRAYCLIRHLNDLGDEVTAAVVAATLRHNNGRGGLSERTGRRLLQQLEAAGWLSGRARSGKPTQWLAWDGCGPLKAERLTDELAHVEERGEAGTGAAVDDQAPVSGGPVSRTLAAVPPVHTSPPTAGSMPSTMVQPPLLMVVTDTGHRHDTRDNQVTPAAADAGAEACQPGHTPPDRQVTATRDNRVTPKKGEHRTNNLSTAGVSAGQVMERLAVVEFDDAVTVEFAALARARLVTVRQQAINDRGVALARQLLTQQLPARRGPA